MAQPRSSNDLDADLEILMNAEGLAMRAGPRPQLQDGVLALLREAIKTERVVALRYFGQSSKKLSWQRVQPYGVLYGNRAFLVGMTAWAKGARLWRLANATEVRAAPSGRRRSVAVVAGPCERGEAAGVYQDLLCVRLPRCRLASQDALGAVGKN